MENGFQMQFLGGHKWEALFEVKSHLIAKHAYCTGPSPVGLFGPVLKDMVKKFKILLHS
jgi:hypothetical protein